MAAHGEKTWPSVGTSNGRAWGGSHGRCSASERTAASIWSSISGFARLLLMMAASDGLWISRGRQGRRLATSW